MALYATCLTYTIQILPGHSLLLDLYTKYSTYHMSRYTALLRYTVQYVEIKCQLDATDDIYCRFYCLLNMFRGTIMPIIRSSRVLYRWSLPVVFGALVFKLSVWCGAEGYVSGLRAAAASNKICNKYHLLHLVGILFPHINDDAQSKSLQIYDNTSLVSS